MNFVYIHEWFVWSANIINFRTTGLLTVTDAQFQNMQSLVFNIGSVSLASHLQKAQPLSCHFSSILMSSLPTLKSGPGPSILRLGEFRVIFISSSLIWAVWAVLVSISSVCISFAPFSRRQEFTLLSFLDGFVFLQRFYSVFDTTNSQVGLATTDFTQATTNWGVVVFCKVANCNCETGIRSIVVCMYDIYMWCIFWP